MFESSITDVSTVKILDQYLESKEQYFLIVDNFNIIFKRKIYDVNFVISNKIEVGKQIVSTNITLTEFKKIYGSRFNYLEDILNYKERITDINRTRIPKFTVPVMDFIEIFKNHFEENFDNSKEDEIIFFDNPISINAQSSKNRTGYGNEYFYDLLVYEGTKYGETSQFPIVGYIFNVNKDLTNMFFIN